MRERPQTITTPWTSPPNGPAGASAASRSSSSTPEGAKSSAPGMTRHSRSEEHTSELQSRPYLVCRLLLEKKKLSQGPASPADAVTSSARVPRLLQG